jgi:hypothetical protein
MAPVQGDVEWEGFVLAQAVLEAAAGAGSCFLPRLPRVL